MKVLGLENKEVQAFIQKEDKRLRLEIITL
jgi:hypothetical protein